MKHRSSFIRSGLSHTVVQQAMARRSYPLPWKHFDRKQMQKVKDIEDQGYKKVCLQYARYCEHLGGAL